VRFRVVLSLVVPSLVLARTARAQDGEVELVLSAIEDVEQIALSTLLEQPVTAVSRYASKPADSPTLVSTIDRDTIERFGYRTVRDALQGSRGVYVGNDRNYSYLGARGFSVPGDYNTRFALSIDNHRFNDAVYGQASIGAELGLPMIAIERIELIRGGAWSVHGENALLGAVQIVTASGATRPGLAVTSTTRGTAETYGDPSGRPAVASRGEDVAASYGTVRNGIDVFVAGSYSYDPGLAALYMPELATTGEPCVDARGMAKICDGVVVGNDREESASTYLSLRTKHLTVHALAAQRYKDVPTAAFLTVIGSKTSTRDDRLFLDVEYARSSKHTDVVAHVSADHFGYHGTYPLVDEGEDLSARYENNDGGTANTLNGELRGRYRWFAPFAHVNDAEAAVGAEAMSATTRQFSTDLRMGENVSILDRTDPVSTVSLFGHTRARFADHFVGFAAVRGDYHPDSFGLAVSPQAGIVLDGDRLGRIRASISRGYRAPTPYERFFYVDPDMATSLDPEVSQTRELSLERYLGEHVRLLVVGFEQRVDGLIGLSENVNGVTVFQNLTGSRSYGVESEIEGSWKKLRLRANYTWQHARTSEGETPANAPSSLANLMLWAPLAEGRADVGIESSYIGSRTSYDHTTIAPRFTANVVLTVHDIVKSLDATLGVTNVFDDRGADPGSEEHRQGRIPQDPRTIWLRLGVRLDP
jgi:iron complex outermembrane receptor protein